MQVVLAALLARRGRAEEWIKASEQATKARTRAMRRLVRIMVGRFKAMERTPRLGRTRIFQATEATPSRYGFQRSVPLNMEAERER
jgi:hypothetical protein